MSHVTSQSPSSIFNEREHGSPSKSKGETGVSFDLSLSLMSYVLAGRIIEREMRASIVLGLFLMGYVLEDHKIESEMGVSVDLVSFLTSCVLLVTKSKAGLDCTSVCANG